MLSRGKYWKHHTNQKHTIFPKEKEKKKKGKQENMLECPRSTETVFPKY